MKLFHMYNVQNKGWTGNPTICIQTTMVSYIVTETMATHTANKYLMTAS